MTLSRRHFLKISSAAGGGLLLGFQIACKDKAAKIEPSAPAKKTVDAESSASEVAPPPVAAAGGGMLSAWVHIAPNDVITLTIPEAEMGQGVLTGLAMILAEHLEADFATVRAVQAPANPAAFGRQSTGGSTSVRMGYETVAAVGATGRELLVRAAAKRWGVKAAELTARSGQVSRKDKEALRFGALADEASKIELPADFEPTIKPWSEHTLIGTYKRRVDTYGKVTGQAKYGLDVSVPEMLTAVIARSPSVGGTATKIDDSAAKALDGVVDVVSVSSGPAVLARHYWAAKKGRDALKVSWREPNAKLDDAEIRRRMIQVIDRGIEAEQRGASEPTTERILSAEYEVPYLAHAPLELLSCTARVGDGECEIWVSTQSPSTVQQTAAEVTGIAPDKVVVHTMFLGGGFGRRSQGDYVRDAVEVAKASGKTVKVVWDREDDIRGYRYRPCALNRFRGAVDDRGLPVFWEHRIASPSILRQMRPLLGGVDGTSVEGASNLPYAIPNFRVTYADVELPVSTWFWRSVGSSQNAYVTECFFDELCRLGGTDPVEARLALLTDHPRHAKVLSVAAEKAGWGKTLPAGEALGVALHESFGSIVAQVARVSVDGTRPKVHEVHCAVDCGKVINPDNVRAQMDSGIAFGLTAALYGNIHFDKGRVVEGNFDTYPILRMSEMPSVTTHIVASGAKLGGIGEPGTPPIAPAVVNALHALTQKPIRRLPIAL